MIVRIISLVTPLIPRERILYVLLTTLIPPLFHLLLKRLHINRIHLLRLRCLQHKHQRVVLRRHYAEIVLIPHSVPVKVAISVHLALTNKEPIFVIGLSIRRREARAIVRLAILLIPLGDNDEESQLLARFLGLFQQVQNMPDISDHALLHEGWVALIHSFFHLVVKETALGAERRVRVWEAAAVGVQEGTGVHGRGKAFVLEMVLRLEEFKDGCGQCHLVATNGAADGVVARVDGEEKDYRRRRRRRHGWKEEWSSGFFCS